MEKNIKNRRKKTLKTCKIWWEKMCQSGRWGENMMDAFHILLWHQQPRLSPFKIKRLWLQPFKIKRYCSDPSKYNSSGSDPSK